MKHFVALSLVFFSLTQLAKADRAEALRLLTEGYCTQQQVSFQKSVQADFPSSKDQDSYFLSSSDLALMGTLYQVQKNQYFLQNQVLGDLIFIKKPNNNSP